MTTDPIDRNGLSARFLERKPLAKMNQREWEALCDGCGKCCLNKLEDEDTGEVALTCVACRLLDDETCRCTQYDIRHQFVPECIVMTPGNINEHAYWLPQTCAYRLLWEGKPLYDWHPLISGTPDSVHAAGVSVQGRTVSEFETPMEEWEDYIIEEPN
ncbi:MULTISPECIES: YcgN family cysteine cluster protein [unclassified Ruegeria]|uniref:YcgN family cysteine cluster protein n=1 Tax=unclassified Ruegeria TaxID=2625375 RepID=UPI001ADCDAE4|nr:MULTISPECIES: YcgN family cysteine cluster protein [unclassified Ruegeria]MBO9411058.1 YcgN family cysteine cluster protein [Ruegeria sp. R8_1]MBO9415259.1 YcgN family cysteine cluster protein [Ruegeria sp. R8_2]